MNPVRFDNRTVYTVATTGKLSNMNGPVVIVKGK